ncbi:hypothetical protein CDAR_168911 [Caerostris darwini]|uniref:Uncharacterized protein n=1 Tax=Caerostris darwini TaxID=1538125 RepID=A0AAV4UB11_9ARAC|nr:hypothetical protein CDAR_314331 [Caerostris darwini]GIY84556.1 hypothetical protein CDAR_168911 [Caerostris darwini]
MCHTYSPMTEYHPSASLLGFHREKEGDGPAHEDVGKALLPPKPRRTSQDKTLSLSLARFSLTTKQVVSWWVTVSTFCSLQRGKCFDLSSGLCMWKRMDLR